MLQQQSRMEDKLTTFSHHSHQFYGSTKRPSTLSSRYHPWFPSSSLQPKKHKTTSQYTSWGEANAKVMTFPCMIHAQELRESCMGAIQVRQGL